MDPGWQPRTGAAQWRKQRRLRSWWRHEQQSIAAALATLQHHSATGTEEGQGRGGGYRGALHGDDPGESSSPGGGQCVLWPVLDAPVPQVEQLVEVLTMPDVEQVIEVPKLAQEDGTPLRAVLREPRVAEHLVDVPVPHTVILADGRDDRGIRWRHLLGRSGGSRWWMVGTNHTKRDRTQGFTASPGRQTNIGQRGLPVVDVPMTMLHKFQKFVVDILILVPQIQFIDKVLDVAVMPQRQVRNWCELCRRPGRFLSTVLWGGCCRPS